MNRIMSNLATVAQNQLFPSCRGQKMHADTKVREYWPMTWPAVTLVERDTTHRQAANDFWCRIHKRTVESRTCKDTAKLPTRGAHNYNPIYIHVDRIAIKLSIGLDTLIDQEHDRGAQSEETTEPERCIESILINNRACQMIIGALQHLTCVEPAPEGRRSS